MPTKTSIEHIPEKLRELPIYPKVCSMIDYVMCQALEDYEDISSKFKDPDVASEDVIVNTIAEYGFSYINDIVDTLTQVDLNILLHFISLLHLLKGHREGLELVLKVLGLEATLEEWWEQTPKAEAHTFKMGIVVNPAQIDDLFLTIDRLRRFTRQYVYPIFDIAELIFDIELAQAVAVFSGFHHYDRDCEIVGTIP